MKRLCQEDPEACLGSFEQVAVKVLRPLNHSVVRFIARYDRNDAVSRRGRACCIVALCNTHSQGYLSSKRNYGRLHEWCFRFICRLKISHLLMRPEV